MIFKQKRVHVLIGYALAAGAFTLTATAVQAQQKVERIEVTGTRIPPPNLESSSPVSVVTAQDIAFDGLRSVENMLNNLPQVFADQGGNVSNGATGTATVNLRNLGATRTLVLVNGRRLPPGSPKDYATDLNEIPAPLIKQVEILTGGAGAVYGSDAVAGVVNFIMNDKFEGVQLQVNQSFYNHGQQNKTVSDIINARAVTNPTNFKVPGDVDSDGNISDANLLVGGNFANGKGNATVFFSYKQEDALLQSQRDFSACALASSATGFSCGGSSTSYPGRFIGPDGRSRTVANAAGGTRAFSAATDQYNYGPLNYFQRPSERYGFDAFAHYNIDDHTKVYSEFAFHDDHTVAQIAPSGLFGFDASGANTIHFENPFLSPSWKTDLGLTGPGTTADTVIFRRNVEGGGRQDDIRHSSFRAVAGLKGEFAKSWNYDIYAQTGKVIYQEEYKNDFSNVRIGRALDAVVDPATGQTVCRSKLNGTDPNCVPYNIWALGQINPAALSYVSTPGFQKGFTSETTYGGNLSVDLGDYGWKLPMAKNGVGFSIGAEQRTDRLQLDTDTEFTTGDLAGQGGPTIGLGGSTTVKEIFGELRVPLVEGREFAHLLSVNGSYRNSDYGTGQKTDSYGLGLDWAPIQQARFRGSYQRATRAANVVELFTAQSLGLYNNSNDPCAGPTPSATLAQCQRTGVTAAQYGNIIDSPAGQYNALFGGNPNLKPEKSDSYTLGLVLTPMKNLSGTIDYFDIRIKDTIGTIPSPTALTECLTTGSFCNLITRDRLGSLWALPAAQVLATNLNLGAYKTTGVDLGVNYVHRLNGLGSLNFDLIGTLLSKYEVEPIPGLGKYDCKGLYGSGTCGTPLPTWRHKLRGTWMTPWDVNVAVTWRYMSSVDFEKTSSQALLTGPFNPVDAKLAAQNYLDLAASWAVTKRITLNGGINNVMDKDPPVSSQVGAGFGNGNTYPQVYDALGRRVFLNLTAKF